MQNSHFVKLSQPITPTQIYGQEPAIKIEMFKNMYPSVRFYNRFQGLAPSIAASPFQLLLQAAGASRPRNHKCPHVECTFWGFMTLLWSAVWQ